VGDSRPLIEFVATTYDEALSLLRSSLKRLLEVQETLATQMGIDG
jgi:hypothetical protein